MIYMDLCFHFTDGSDTGRLRDFTDASHIRFYTREQKSRMSLLLDPRNRRTATHITTMIAAYMHFIVRAHAHKRHFARASTACYARIIHNTFSTTAGSRRCCHDRAALL